VGRIVTVYSCQHCGAQTRQFFGRCPACGAWNSLVEERLGMRPSSSVASPEASPQPLRSEAINRALDPPVSRLASGSLEFDRVLGGGLVPGSLVLVGGDPGIGKSTLLLQSATAMASREPVLYVSAEESAQQVRLRWHRLRDNACTTREAASSESGQGLPGERLRLLAETDLERVLEELRSLRPAVAVIDSIQALCDDGLSSAPGSVAQVRECASALQRLAKRQGTALLLVGHVTKDGVLAGPKVLEHLVDAVLTFEGDRFASHRLLRAVKNRYGATHELGVFEMRSGGLQEVTNPSELFLSSGAGASGVATIVACEGTRPLVVELQALVNTTVYASPRRTATGISTNRLHQILAVLERHLSLPLSRYDCYLAVAAGLAVEEPASDMGVAAAVMASCRNLILPAGTVLIGEVGLGGQIRPVSQLELRLQGAARLGFRRAVIPSAGRASPPGPSLVFTRGGADAPAEESANLSCVPVRTLSEAMVAVLGDDGD